TILKESALAAFARYLLGLLPPVPLDLSSAAHVVDFLISKDLSGNTQFHSLDCPHKGAATSSHRRLLRCVRSSCPNPSTCPHLLRPASASLACPLRAAPNSLERQLSLLKTGFHARGRLLPWCPTALSGNPADAPYVRSYIDFVRRDASKSLISPVQANPVFRTKVALAVAAWRADAARFARDRGSFPLLARLICLQNVAFCLLASEATRRGGDIDRLHPLAVVWLPNYSGLHLSLYQGKVLTGSRIDRLAIPLHSDPLSCVVRALRAYAVEAVAVGFPLVSSRFLFPSTTPDRLDFATSLSYKVIQSRFESILRSIGAFANDTIHGMRVAGALSTRVSNDSLSAVMAKGDWASAVSAARYSALASAVDTSDAALPEADWQASLLSWKRDHSEFLFLTSLRSVQY
ncbi:hypothetical protein HDU67_004400, partial [Dinochytrium kinnereticum]